MDIANTLKEFRQQHGMEQDELARLLETTQQTVSNWENGTVPRASALHRINHVLTNYKAGEGITPPPRRVLNAAVNEIHGIKVKSPEESRMWVADAMGLNKTPSDRLLVSPRQQLEEQILKLLPDKLEVTFNAMFEHQGLRARAGFFTNNIVCNTLPLWAPREESRHHSFHLFRLVEASAMRLMTIRAIQRIHGFERKIYALLAVIPQEALQQLNPTRAIAFASLHDIRLILVPSVEQAAKAIESLAEEAKPAPKNDFIDEDDLIW